MTVDDSIFFYHNCTKYIDNHSILLYGRKVTTKVKINFLVDDFFPYFGVAATEDNMKKAVDLKNKKIVLKTEFLYNDDAKRAYYDQYGGKVMKVLLPATDDVRIARKVLKKTYQDDVPYERAFRIDKNIYSFFVVDEIGKVLKQNPVKITTKGKNPMTSEDDYYILSHWSVKGF